MTKEEKLIVSAYTGFLMCDWDDLHKFIEDTLGRPVWTHELADDKVKEEIRLRLKPRFLAICAAREESSQPRWIPVTERLPEHGVHVLAACYVKWLGGGGRYYVCDAFHTEHFRDTCGYSDEIDMEYNEDEDEYYMPEGWWEVIKNWDDYSCVAIGDFVTYWMPLPEPPKEGHA